MAGGLSEGQVASYTATNERNAEKLKESLEGADYVFIHDPQPAALLGMMPGRKGKWIWRCHIDVSAPNRSVWRFVKKQVEGYDASIFSLPDFAQPLSHPQFLITPSIDPLSEKNIPLSKAEVEKTYRELGVPRDKPVILQVSRLTGSRTLLGSLRATGSQGTRRYPACSRRGRGGG
jgi:trehalose synthase